MQKCKVKVASKKHGRFFDTATGLSNFVVNFSSQQKTNRGDNFRHGFYRSRKAELRARFFAHIDFCRKSRPKQKF